MQRWAKLPPRTERNNAVVAARPAARATTALLTNAVQIAAPAPTPKCRRPELIKPRCSSFCSGTAAPSKLFRFACALPGEPPPQKRTETPSSSLAADPPPATHIPSIVHALAFGVYIFIGRAVKVWFAYPTPSLYSPNSDLILIVAIAVHCCSLSPLLYHLSLHFPLALAPWKVSDPFLFLLLRLVSTKLFEVVPKKLGSSAQTQKNLLNDAADRTRTRDSVTTFEQDRNVTTCEVVEEVDITFLSSSRSTEYKELIEKID